MKNLDTRTIHISTRDEIRDRSWWLVRCSSEGDRAVGWVLAAQNSVIFAVSSLIFQEFQEIRNELR